MSVETEAKFFDHTQITPETPTTEDSQKEAVKEEKKEPDPLQSEEGTEKKEGDEGDEGDENKPWKAKKANATPAWAKKRFREYSQKVHELQRQNEELLAKIQPAAKPEEKQELKRESFETEAEYLEAKLEEKLQEKLSELDKQRQAEYEVRARHQQLMQADRENAMRASVDLPDYQEVIASGDPDIRLPQSVIQHLTISPAGPYVKYRIAQDEALAEALKDADRLPAQQREATKHAIVAQVHDEVLEYLIQKQGAAQPANAGQAAPPVQQMAQRALLPKAPPAVKKSTKIDRNSLSGDEYVRARNEGRI